MAVSVDSLIKKAETNMGKNINPVVKQTAIEEPIKKKYMSSYPMGLGASRSKISCMLREEPIN